MWWMLRRFAEVAIAAAAVAGFVLLAWWVLR